MEEKKTMQEIWKKLLNLSDLPGVNESFFDLGGNSFIANDATANAPPMAMASNALGSLKSHIIEIADFFENDTIDTLLG